MLLPLGAAAIVAAELLWELALPRLRLALPRIARVAVARWRARNEAWEPAYDPGRELRAEQRARELLRSCVNEQEWAMYRDLGFIRVWGRGGVGRRDAAEGTGGRDVAEGRGAGDRDAAGGRGASGREAAGSGAPYAYLLYPHKPIVAYVPQTRALLNEYCVAFPDETRPYGSARLPDADDVLAKWMALNADERRLIADANMHLPGRQVDPKRVCDDLARLERWERERLARPRRAGSGLVGVVDPGLGRSEGGHPRAVMFAKGERI
jgi:hypothetical protein